MEPWVALTLGAAFFQNLRSALQKGLAARHGVIGITFARFVFALPVAALAVAGLAALGTPLPRPTPGFFLAAGIGAAAQVGATLLLVALFSLRNFAVGNTFAKTETVQAALIGAVLLGDTLGPGPIAAILVSLAGILMLSGSGLGAGLSLRAAAMGLGAGAGFAVSGVAYRAASLALQGDAGYLMRAAVTLALVTALQTAAMGAWLALRRPETLAGVLRDGRRTGLVGLAGAIASLGWFAALALQPAALVKAVGQVELLFSYLTARAVFRETPSARELAGILLVTAGIVFLVLTA